MVWFSNPFVFAVWLETTLRIWFGHWRMVYVMWIAMELLPVKQLVQKMLQGAAREEAEEERGRFGLACPAELLMIIIGLVSNVPMQMSDLPPHARCAINCVDENQLETHVVCSKCQHTAEMESVIWVMCWFLFVRPLNITGRMGVSVTKKCYPPCNSYWV